MPVDWVPGGVPVGVPASAPAGAPVNVLGAVEAAVPVVMLAAVAVVGAVAAPVIAPVVVLEATPAVIMPVALPVKGPVTADAVGLALAPLPGPSRPSPVASTVFCPPVLALFSFSQSANLLRLSVAGLSAALFQLLIVGVAPKPSWPLPPLNCPVVASVVNVVAVVGAGAVSANSSLFAPGAWLVLASGSATST